MLKFFFAGFMGWYGCAAQAKTLHLAVANTRQPYIISETQSGIELDILKAATTRMGCELKLTFVASMDLPSVINDKDIDGINSIYEIKTVPLYYSDPDISYQNRVISLKKKKLDIKAVADLSKYSIAAFANAKFSFGEDFKKIVERNKYYTEYKDQSIQPKLLYSERVDVVIADINIFRYNSRNLKNANEADLIYTNILKPTYYSVAFKDSRLRDEFNKALHSIRSDGTYQKILDHYKESLISQ